MKEKGSKYKKSDVLLIKWVDSNHTLGWSNEDDFEDVFDAISEVYISTVGFFLKENKDFISVIQSRDNQFDTTCDALLVIPKKAILKIEILNKGEE